MMIKRKFKEELDDIQKEHYKIMNSENRKNYLKFSNDNSKKKLFEKQNKNPIKIQLKTETKNESKINNNIITRRIFGFSFKKPELKSYMDKFYYQKIKENEIIDYSPYNKTANKNIYQSFNNQQLLLNSISYKGDEENSKNDNNNINSNRVYLKTLLNSPNNRNTKSKKYINNSITSIKINEFKIDDNDIDNEHRKDNKENEDKNSHTIKSKIIKSYVFNKQKPNNIHYEKKIRIKKDNHIFRNVDSVTNLKISNSNNKSIIKELFQNKKNKNISHINKNASSERNMFSNNDRIKKNKIIINNSLDNIKNEINNTMLNTHSNINSIKKIKIINKNFSTNKIKNNNNKNLNQSNSFSEKYNINNTSFKNDTKIEIKIEDLIMIEERLNDISIVLNRNNITIDSDASNECIEFFSFYFNSSIKNTFPLFFNENNRLIIKSAINLNLFVVIIIYHLSMNLSIFTHLFSILLSIFELLKQNLYLIIKKIQIYYGDSSLLNNEIYFKTFNYIFKKNNILDLNEKEIIIKIKNNCFQIVSSFINILNCYEKKENEYFIDFLDIFNRISIINEKDLNNYFCLHLFYQSGKPLPEPIKKYEGKSKSKKNKNINNPSDNIDSKNDDKNQKIKNILMDYKIKQVKSPFLITPCNKKYTLVLDLDETLVNVKINEDINDINDISRYTFNLRPGLFSFLNGVKPYYELISFTNASKEYSDVIINQIEKVKKYFDFNFYREHSTLIGTEFVKDISKIGRDMKKIIIVDNVEDNFRLNKENGILIAPYKGEESKNDMKLFFLKNILLTFNNKNYKDLRIALKDYYSDIKNNITSDNDKN